MGEKDGPQTTGVLREFYDAAAQVAHVVDKGDNFAITQQKGFRHLADCLRDLQNNPSALDNVTSSVTQKGYPKLLVPWSGHPKSRLAIAIKPDGLSFSLESIKEDHLYGKVSYVPKASIKFTKTEVRSPQGRSAENFRVVTRAVYLNNEVQITSVQPPVASFDAATDFFSSKVQLSA